MHELKINISDNSAHLKAIIDTAVDGIITINIHGKILTVNPSITRLFGYETSELLGQNIAMLMTETFSGKHEQYLENYMKTGIGKIIGTGREVVGKRKDGKIFPFLLSISELHISQEKIFSGIVHDISELKEVKDALQKEMMLNELKSRFITMASHEFRTPLSAILSSATLIGKYNEKHDEAKRTKHIDRIKSSVANLTSILNDFLSLNKLEEGSVYNNPVEFDVIEISNDILEELQPMLKEGQHVQYEHTGNILQVTLDKILLKSIIINLLSNAIKYSSNGKRIEFKTYTNKNNLQILIKDEGIGIPESDKVHLFGRFFRAQNATSIQGTGLGLNIVKKHVDLLDGTIEFESELDKGTSFTVIIPFQNKNT